MVSINDLFMEAATVQSISVVLKAFRQKVQKKRNIVNHLTRGFPKTRNFATFMP